jgi:hypothetical protein
MWQRNNSADPKENAEDLEIELIKPISYSTEFSSTTLAI